MKEHLKWMFSVKSVMADVGAEVGHRRPEKVGEDDELQSSSSPTSADDILVFLRTSQIEPRVI